MTTLTKKPFEINRFLEKVVFSVVFLISILLVARVVMLGNVGIDLTDEGYYFNWISNPWLYKYYASQFGYIYHPLYKALGDSIVYLRQANALISYGLAWLLSYQILKKHTVNISTRWLLVASTSLALPALFILMITGYWSPSPSYNSLNFQGCLIIAMGFLLAEQQAKKQLMASGLIGIGGWLMFMAKPSSALLIAMTTVIFYLPSIKRDWRILVWSGLVAVTLLIISALLIDGSIGQFIKRYQGGFLLLSTLSNDYGIGHLVKLGLFSVSSLFKLKFIFLTLLVFLAFLAEQHAADIVKKCLQLLLIVVSGITLTNVLFPALTFSDVPRYHTLILLTLTVAAFACAVFSNRDTSHAPSRKLVMLFLVMPYLYAAGTNNNYWQTAAGASVFWVLATVLVLVKKRVHLGLLTILVVFVAVLSANSLLGAIQSPYRQSEPIFNQVSNYVDTRTEQPLKLSKDTANYLNTLKTVANQNGFKHGTPVIDLTGHHPGALYFMQAQAIGLAWMSGGHQGSRLYVELALNQATCEEIANAWVLLEKDGRRRIPEAVLQAHGIEANKITYIKVGKLSSQSLSDAGAVNQSHPDGVYQQYLLKPVDVQKQSQNCTNYRKQHTNPFNLGA